MAWTDIVFSIGAVLGAGDLNKVVENIRQVRISHLGNAAPASPEAATEWWDNSTGTWLKRIYTGSQWVPMLFFNPVQMEAGPAPSSGNGWGTYPVVTASRDRTAYSGPLMTVRNMALNGSMRYWQRGNSWEVGSYHGYTADRWMIDGKGSGWKVEVRQSSEHPDLSASAWSMEIQVSDEKATLSSGDILQVIQPIEGTMHRRTLYGLSAARPSRLSAWFWSGVTGRFSWYLSNASRDAVLLGAFDYDTASTWKFIEYVVPPATSGGWANDTQIGCWFGVTLAAQTQWRTASIDAWRYGAADDRACSGQLQGLTASGTIFRLTDLQWELGAAAAPIDPLPAAIEIPMLQRYYCKTFATDDAPKNGVGKDNFESALGTVSDNGGQVMITWQYRGMRDTPTVAYYCPGSFQGPAWWDRSDHTAGRWALTFAVGPDSLVITAANSFASGGTNDHGLNRHMIHATADAELY